jgi:putative phosphoribosyl transferase
MNNATISNREVDAVVSRGGRPDLAAVWLHNVRAPTLLIVGGNDPQVLALNRQALAQLECPARLEVVPGASHLFEEPGTLEQATQLARDWLVRHLIRPRYRAGSPTSGSTSSAVPN